VTVVDGWRIWFGERYPDGGGLTAEGRARREAVRLQAAAVFAQEVPVEPPPLSWSFLIMV
jgi:hypothetical protein